MRKVEAMVRSLDQIRDISRHAPVTRRGFLVGTAGVGVALAGGLTGCGSTPSRPAHSAKSGARGQAQENVTFILDVTPYGPHTPFFVAKYKGFWKDRGLNVAIEPGKGSADTATKVAAGAGDLGFTDTSAVIQARANRGLKLKLVCMYYYKNLMSCLTLKSSGIREPSDLAGKTVVEVPGDADVVLLPALAKINGFDATKVTINRATFPSLVPSVLNHKADATLDYFPDWPVLQAGARKSGETPSYFLYADYGLDVYNNGVSVTEATLASRADMVRAFTHGLAEAVKYTVANPEDAVSLFVDHASGIDKTIAKAQQQIAINHCNVSEVRKHGFGPMSHGKMAHTLDIYSRFYQLKHPISSANVIYSNDYVPKGIVPQFKVLPKNVQVP